MVGWSGAGSLDDLERTVIGKVGESRSKPVRVAQALLMPSVDPVKIAGQLALMPGVSWISVGFRSTGEDGFLRDLEVLAKRYLSRGETFRISPHIGNSERSAGDVVLAGNSHLLSVVKGAKVGERRPDVKFHVAIEGEVAACGVEIRSGPGGYPTDGHWATCLVSGGERSSAMAWMAALSGFSLRLVHSATGEAELRSVARLYSELSFRMDARSLELVVLDGGRSPAGRIGSWLKRHPDTAFAGMRPRAPGALRRAETGFPNLQLPLTLLQDDAIHDVYASLGLGKAPRSGGVEVQVGEMERGSAYTERRFGRVTVDSNVVIDALRRSSGRQ